MLRIFVIGIMLATGTILSVQTAAADCVIDGQENMGTLCYCVDALNRDCGPEQKCTAGVGSSSSNQKGIHCRE